MLIGFCEKILYYILYNISIDLLIAMQLKIYNFLKQKLLLKYDEKLTDNKGRINGKFLVNENKKTKIPA